MRGRNILFMESIECIFWVCFDEREKERDRKSGSEKKTEKERE